MSSDSSKSNRSPTPRGNDATSASRRKFKPTARSVDIDSEAMETFSFNVSAAEAADLQQKVRIDTASNANTPTQRFRFHQPPSSLVDSEPTPTNQDTSSEQTSGIHIVLSTKPKQKTPSWVASLMLHAVLLLPLGFLSQAGQPVPDDSVLFSLEPSEQLEQIEILEDVEFAPPEELEAVDLELVPNVSDPGIAGLSDLSAESTFQELSGEMAVNSESLSDLGVIFGEAGQGSANFGEGLGNAPLADFFGTKIEGNRIVFVLDNSGGMITGEFETLIAELLRSVESLTPKQQFYVIFYSDALYPIFYPNAPQHFVRATDENKRLLERWLDTVELCVGNEVDEALAAATAIRPDVVYLLTDGDLDSTRDQRRLRFLLDRTGRSFPIHTFGIGTGKTGKAAQKLKQVAEANGGSFRAVEIAPDAVVLAKIKARVYHNKSPGEVWGLRVGKRSR
ncbi:MAG: VWA domain-containing protein [Planctomycetes bacterium]|nr:VWA domain-containing protein [Planctomycetota bacterium]